MWVVAAASTLSKAAVLGGLGGYVIALSAVVAVVGALGAAYVVFKSKGMEASNKILRDLNDDMSSALNYEKKRFDELDIKYKILLDAERYHDDSKRLLRDVDSSLTEYRREERELGTRRRSRRKSNDE